MTSGKGFAGRWFSAVTIIPTKQALRIVDAGAIGQKAVARVPLKAGTVINEWDSPVKKAPTMHTVQFDEHIHAAPTQGAEFISHGCAGCTNTRIVVAPDRKSAQFVVSRDVEQGEDLFFNYNITEWDMDSCFVCACPVCQTLEQPRFVNGFKHLSLSEQKEIAHEASPFIREKAAREALEHLIFLREVSNREQEDYYDLARTSDEDEDQAAVYSSA